MSVNHEARFVLEGLFRARAFTGKDARAVLRIHGISADLHALEAAGVIERSGSTRTRWRIT